MRPEVKAEIERLARQGKGKREHVSVSQTAAALLEKAIQGHIDMQYGALLRPVIETVIRRELAALSTRGANLSVNAFYSAEQARILLIQLLAYVLGEESDILPGLIAQARDEAHKNLRGDLLHSLEKD